MENTTNEKSSQAGKIIPFDVKPKTIDPQVASGQKNGYNDISGSKKEGAVHSMPDLEKYYDLIREDMRAAEARSQAAEKRISDERKESETRINKLVDELHAEAKERSAQIDARFERLEAKLDQKLDNMMNRIDESARHVQNISIATIAGIAGMVLTVIGLIFTVILGK